VTAGAVVEEVGGSLSRWIRPMAAAFASLAVLAGGAALWECGRRAGTAAPDMDSVALIGTLARVGGDSWLRRRARPGDLRWRRALVLPGGARAGLLAPRSKRALALETLATCGMFVGGLVWAGSKVDGWNGRILTALGVVGLPILAHAVFKRLRHPVLVAITSEGVVAEGKALPWDQIKSVRRDKDGVRLRVRGPDRDTDKGRWVTVGGADCAVSDERLAHVIEYYLATPHRRGALDVNVPGPLGAVR
jgi:hypothetical protein